MEKNRNIILFFYTTLALIAIFVSAPDFTLQNIGFTLSMIALVAAYIARSRFPKNESFEENHTTYLIRTLWIYTSLAAIGITGLGIIVVMNGNMESFNSMADNIVNSGIQPTEEQMEAVIQQYISDNLSLIRQQYLIWLLPAQLYLVWRTLQGGYRAHKNYRISNPKKWL